MALRALARVNLAAVERNCARLAATAAPAELCAVVKADGYGHGAAPVARAALAGGATRLAVATAGEATALRAAGIDAPLLVMGALSAEELVDAVAARADVAAWREGFIEALAATPGAEGIGVHVKLDTGMGRLGTRDPEEAARVARAAAEAPGLRLAGAMTHFATSDDDPAFVREQLAAFTPWAERLRAEHGDLLVHAANSAAALTEPAARFDLVRCGIAVYGLDPFHRDPADHGLEPALELHTYVAEVKRIAPGQSAGYGRRFVAREPGVARHAADRLRRRRAARADQQRGRPRAGAPRAAGRDRVDGQHHGRPRPGEREPVPRGAPAVVIGPQAGEAILAEEVAARLGTINYEVVCGISARVPREHHRDGTPA